MNQQAYIKREMRFLRDVQVRFEFDPPKGNFDIVRHPFETPIVINNFNRVKYLSALVDSLRERGYENIYVIDNASTYEPVFDYYKTAQLRVFHLDTNVGYLALWRTHVRQHFERYHYVYSDPDVVPISECPADFIAMFHQILELSPQIAKVGFGLKIDDIPAHYPLREEVMQHERRFWMQPLDQRRTLYAAPIDTTFALYRPKMTGGWWLPAVRTSVPYMARHLPWYENPNSMTEEQVFYKESAAINTHWSDLEKRVLEKWPPHDDLVPWSRNSVFWSGSANLETVSE